MDFHIAVLLTTSLLIAGVSSQYDYGSLEEPNEPQLPQEMDEPYPYDGWDMSQTGCQTHFTRSRCVYEVFCSGITTEEESRVFGNSPFSVTSCQIISESEGGLFQEVRRYGEVHVKIQGIPSHGSTVLEKFDRFRAATTELDLSDNELFSFEIAEMKVLRTLVLSKNSFTNAFFYNKYELKNLSTIDYSYNTINTIKVDRNRNTFKDLKTINLAHNYLVNIEEGIFANFPELEKLDLSHNFIAVLNILTFEGVKNLVTLKLNDNRLSQLDMSLVRFNKLETLILSNNGIQSLKFTDFEKLGSLKLLDVSSNIISEIETHTFSKMNSLHTLNLRDNAIHQINTEMFENLTELASINLSKNNIQRLATDIFKNKTIWEFSIKQNQLEGALMKGTFEGMRFVTKLDLSQQYITSVEDYAFNGIQHVIKLLLNDNFINNLSSLSFRNLRNLKTLDLTNNMLTNIEFVKDDLVSLESLLLKNNQLIQIKRDFFIGLYALQFLDISQNNITHLETNSFKSLSGLLNLQIASNPVSGVLEENTFNGLNSLPNLDVSGTLLTTLKNGSFNGMTNLKVLNLSHSEIVELQFNAFQNTGIIETIDFSYNKLTYFIVNTTDLKSLFSLNLKNNSLTVISCENFKELPHLSRIILANNNIESIEDDALVNQLDLRYIDLSFNLKLKFNVSVLKSVRDLDGLHLSGIRSNISFQCFHELTLPYLDISQSEISNITVLDLKNLNNLRYLFLGKNKITKVEAQNFKGVKSLLKLDLSFNRINYIQPGSFVDNSLLNFLNISHNLLKAVNYGIFRGLTYLNIIDMSYNEISELQSERFYEVRSLSKLIADHNKISSISADDFLGTQLSSLSIGENPIPCEILVNLKRSRISFLITAINLVENSDFENIDGVTCNVNRHVSKNENMSENLNETILLVIKDILRNITSNGVNGNIPVFQNSSNTNYFVDISHMIENGNDKISNLSVKVQDGNYILQEIKEETNNTNLLLVKLLTVLTANKDKKQEPTFLPKENYANETLSPYINKIKKQLEDTIATEKKNILTSFNDMVKQNIVLDLENKIKQNNEALEAKINKLNLQINPSKDILPRATATHETYSAKNESDTKSFLFIEICVGLMLVMMIFFILYKFYNSGLFVPSRHSTSTRHLSDPIDSSAL